MPRGPEPPERDVDVAGHHPPRLDAGEQLLIPLAGLGRKVSMSERGEAWQYSVPSIVVGLRQRAQLLHQLVAEQLSGARGDRVDRRRRVVAVHEPAVGVAADPGGVLELLQPLDRLLRPGAGGGVVAAQQEGVGVLRVRQDRLQRGQVAVDVVEQREHQRARYPPDVWAAAEPERS